MKYLILALHSGVAYSIHTFLMLQLYYTLILIVVSYNKAFVLRFQIFELRFGLYCSILLTT